VPTLNFPTDMCVGLLEWPGSYTEDAGPALARGPVEIPDGAQVSLNLLNVTRISHSETGGWWSGGNGQPIDLAFLAELPDHVIDSLTLHTVIPETLPFVTHLAPGLRRLYLDRSDLTDQALSSVATLSGLVYLQTFGNRFTDDGVQVLRSLVALETLYLEEETLTVAAFRFVRALPKLGVLGVRDVPLSAQELDELRNSLNYLEIRE
jgi:hypothetical protein